jgi:hypothetical protein
MNPSVRPGGGPRPLVLQRERAREHAMRGEGAQDRGNQLGTPAWRCHTTRVVCSGLSSRHRHGGESTQIQRAKPQTHAVLAIPSRAARSERRRPPLLQIPAPRGPCASISARGARGAGAEPWWRACSRVPGSACCSGATHHTSTRTGGQRKIEGRPRRIRPCRQRTCALATRAPPGLPSRRSQRAFRTKATASVSWGTVSMRRGKAEAVASGRGIGVGWGVLDWVRWLRPFMEPPRDMA